MASIMAHAAVAFSFSAALPTYARQKGVIALAMFAAMVPDLDVISFKFGIPYESDFGHRGISHSIFFALILALIMPFVFKNINRLVIFTYYFLCTLSHGLLDACTTGGRGVGFFIPISSHRYFFPWQVIKVSPIGIDRFFSEWGLQVLMSEFIWVGIPCILFYFIVNAFSNLGSKI